MVQAVANFLLTGLVAGLGVVVGGCFVLPSLAVEELRDGLAAVLLVSVGLQWRHAERWC